MSNPNPKVEHLKPHQFKEGNTLSPGGKPKIRDDIITNKALELLQKPHPKHPDKTRLEVLAERWINRATRGDGFTELIDRIDGPIIAKTEATVNVNAEPTADAELDGWAKERAAILAAEEAARASQPSGLCGPDRQEQLEVDPPPEPAKRKTT